MAKTQEKPLSDKRQHFVDEYCSNGGNASQAYKKAYPTAKTGHRQNGQRLITNDYIKEAIKVKLTENKVKNEINVEIQRQETIKLRDAAYDAKQYSAAITANDQLNKHAGFYALDNEQQSQSKALTEAQEAEYKEFIAWKRRQMLRPVKAG